MSQTLPTAQAEAELNSMGEAGFHQFLDQLQQLTGYSFHVYSPASLQRRLARAISLHGLGSTGALLQHLQQQPHFIPVLVSELTVGVTEFFRDPEMWAWLRHYYAENLEPNQPLQVWHVGCSTGEEAFSHALLLHELGLAQQAQLQAIDLSRLAIQNAEKSTFSHRKIELLSTNYPRTNPEVLNFHSYFYQQGPNFHIKAELKDMVTFSERNIVDPSAGAGPYDIIMCRNLLIYFNAAFQEELLRRFHRLLRKNGVLVLGLYESISWSSESELYHNLSPRFNIYQKR